MPNLCGNQLRVGGPEDDIARFCEVAVAEDKSEELVFDEFNGSIRDVEDRRIHIAFVSKYCPPLRYLVDLSLQYPRLTFYVEWEEGGHDLFGAAFIEAGEGIGIEQGSRPARRRLPEEVSEIDPEKVVEERPADESGFRGTFLDSNLRSSTSNDVRWHREGF